MAGKIFCRERRKVEEKEKKPRFALVAVAGVDLKVFTKHVRKSELEQIAKAVDAELVFLPHGPGTHEEEEIEVEK